jgi:hypothetical protein
VGRGDDAGVEEAMSNRDPGGMSFGLLQPQMLAVEGGFREARMLDGRFVGWLCPHVHATAQEAKDCPEKESLLKYPPTWPGCRPS